MESFLTLSLTMSDISNYSEKLQLGLCLIYRTSQNIYRAADVQYICHHKSHDKFSNGKKNESVFKPKYKIIMAIMAKVRGVIFYAYHKFP